MIFKEQMPQPFYKECPSNKISTFFEDTSHKKWTKDDLGFKQDCVTHAINVSAGATVFESGDSYHKVSKTDRKNDNAIYLDYVNAQGFFATNVPIM